MRNPVYCVVPNWNGLDSITDCLASLQQQSSKPSIIVVDNGSSDGSAERITSDFPNVMLLRQNKNHGFAGGVNIGIRQAMELGAEYVALFNNDAVADTMWLQNLVRGLSDNKSIGIATGKFCAFDKKHLDSTGDLYTNWGLPYPRGRGEPVSDKYDNDNFVFAASGGASLYRVSMLQEIGLFDEDFFAYYEDVDLSFRAQLAGWKVVYAPQAIAYHHIGATSSKIKGFTTYQTIKNLPLLFWKNVPWRLMPRMFPRFMFAYSLFIARAVSRGQVWPALKGLVVMLLLLPKKFMQRRIIQKSRTVTLAYIESIVTPDLPPNAHALRTLRSKWWKIRGKK